MHMVQGWNRTPISARYVLDTQLSNYGPNRMYSLDAYLILRRLPSADYMPQSILSDPEPLPQSDLAHLQVAMRSKRAFNDARGGQRSSRK